MDTLSRANSQPDPRDRNLSAPTGFLRSRVNYMSNRKKVAVTLISLALLSAGAGYAQTTIPQRGRNVRAANGHVGTARPDPCLQEAGISKSAMEQSRQIERNTQTEIQSVCNDSSLTPEQKREKIRQLHQQAHQQMEGLITPQQREALKACQHQRAAGHPPHPGPPGRHPGGSHGPCGEIAWNRDPSHAGP